MFGKRKWISEAEAEALVRLAQERTEAGQEVDFDAMLGEIRNRKRVHFDTASVASGAAALFLTALAVGAFAFAKVDGGSRQTAHVAEFRAISTADTFTPMPPAAVIEINAARAAELDAKVMADMAKVEAELAEIHAAPLKCEAVEIKIQDAPAQADRVIIRRS